MVEVDLIHHVIRNDERSMAPSVASSTSLSSFSETTDEGPTVAVIGCGPGGMSFLHAVASRRKKLLQNNDVEGLAKLPVVKCFERSSSPGGVWKSAKDGADPTIGTKGEKSCLNTSTSTNMYEGLWINGCKEALEYFDYTFDDHFGRAMPVFLPRAQVLEYMLARMTKHENIFSRVQFNTSVLSVNYDDNKKLFRIRTVDENGDMQVHFFDKCIFSGGLNGFPKFADDIKSMLINQNFKGQIVHSSEMNKLGPSVLGKRIVMVGDSYSAEDLALQCLKLGASKIYITSRRNCGTASNVGSWPDDKVKIVWYQLPYAVENGKDILCRWDEEDEDITTISDVSIVIFCTGYNANTGMLSKELQPWDVDEVPTFPMPKNWRMNDNCLTDILGRIDPPSEIKEESKFVSYKVYKRMLIDNPNMMYLCELSDYPLMEIDVAAWLCLSFISGDRKIPSKEEMRKHNREEILDEMQGMYRYYLDSNYKDACDAIPRDHWYHDKLSEGYKTYLKEWGDYVIKRLACEQNDSMYPISFGNKSELNETGQLLKQMYMVDCICRYKLSENDEDSKWRTFRDTEPSQYMSLFTGTKAVSLKGKWLDLDNNGNINMLLESRDDSGGDVDKCEARDEF